MISLLILNNDLFMNTTISIDHQCYCTQTFALIYCYYLFSFLDVAGFLILLVDFNLGIESATSLTSQFLDVHGLIQQMQSPINTNGYILDLFITKNHEVLAPKVSGRRHSDAFKKLTNNIGSCTDIDPFQTCPCWSDF